MVTLWLLLIFVTQPGQVLPPTPLRVFNHEDQCMAAALVAQMQAKPKIIWAGCAALAVQGLSDHPVPVPSKPGASSNAAPGGDLEF